MKNRLALGFSFGMAALSACGSDEIPLLSLCAKPREVINGARAALQDATNYEPGKVPIPVGEGVEYFDVLDALGVSLRGEWERSPTFRNRNGDADVYSQAARSTETPALLVSTFDTAPIPAAISHTVAGITLEGEPFVDSAQGQERGDIKVSKVSVRDGIARVFEGKPNNLTITQTCPDPEGIVEAASEELRATHEPRFFEE